MVGSIAKPNTTATHRELALPEESRFQIAEDMAADHYLTAGTQVLLTHVTSTCIKYSSEGQTRTMYHSATPSLAAKALCSSVVPWARWEEGKLWSGRVRSVFAFPLVSRPGGRH